MHMMTTANTVVWYVRKLLRYSKSQDFSSQEQFFSSFSFSSSSSSLRFIYFSERERERQSVSGRGAERGGDTESEAGFRLRAASTEPDAGLEPTNREIMTWAEVERSTDWATQAPHQPWHFYSKGRISGSLESKWNRVLMFSSIWEGRQRNTE